MGAGSRELLVTVLVLCVASTIIITSAEDWDDTSIIRRFNQGFEWRAPTWKQALYNCSKHKLYLANIWRHGQEQEQQQQQQQGADQKRVRLPITVLTGLSVSRLPQLARQCASWPGPLIATVWAPVVLAPSSATAAGNSSATDAEGGRRPQQDGQRAIPQAAASEISAASTEIEKLLKEMATASRRLSAAWEGAQGVDQLATSVRSAGSQGCDLTIMLLIQLFEDSYAPIFLYPINKLRNYALAMVHTPLISMVDVDLVLSSQFQQSLVADNTRLQQLEQEAQTGAMFIMPAFEALDCKPPDCSDGIMQGLIAAQGSKELLKNMFLNGTIDAFQCSKGLHFATNFRQFLNSSSLYTVPYVQGAEPWYLGHRGILPFYDMRFAGYGFNKQMQVNYAAANMGARLRVLPDAWLVHLPHPPTVVSVAFNRGGRIKTANSINAQRKKKRPSQRHRGAAAAQVTTTTQTARHLRSPNSTATAPSSNENGKRGFSDQAYAYAHEFHAHMRRTGIGYRYAKGAMMPSDYAPILDDAFKSIINGAPWWAEYRAKWKTGQPSPADGLIDMSQRASIVHRKPAIIEMKRSQMWCSRPQ